MKIKEFKRFDVDFYKNYLDRQTTFEQIFISDKFTDIVLKATNYAKLRGVKYIEFYYKNWFIGSMSKKDKYKFIRGRYFKKSPLLID